ncbi:cytidine deaminase [Mycoplasma bradburyae]|uniref:Cytidine deaminase n=1 Tax=Mycoplasma bradburyae TaxID=2963128 RepID=A0ABT5GAZ9_9MOLU|nr:cytidine deaminase [Mycoplasma bradburyae]MDC4182164.1 cytidine deaminase [Mycoplasma bradburyae]MDC4182929.1 cytidine deaminase [Mycoplasma bradburyae]UTS70267.1 cytidine deaminase [Mycoplasma bradburyae]
MKHKELLELLDKAYCVYSNFRVACILVDSNDQEYKGVNVESASYPVSLCAERNAIGCMVTNSNNIPLIKHIHLMTDSMDKNSSPCGMCRQALWEFSDDDTLVTIYFKDQTSKTYQFKQLIPLGFNYKALNAK